MNKSVADTEFGKGKAGSFGRVFANVLPEVPYLVWRESESRGYCKCEVAG